MLAKNGQNQENKKQRKNRTKSDVYQDALRTEWILMSHYSPEDFQGRFVWPEMRPGLNSHFAGAA